MRVLRQFHIFYYLFITQKNHKMQISDFHSDIFIRQKVLKSKKATFIHKKQRNAK